MSETLRRDATGGLRVDQKEKACVAQGRPLLSAFAFRGYGVKSNRTTGIFMGAESEGQEGRICRRDRRIFQTEFTELGGKGFL